MLETPRLRYIDLVVKALVIHSKPLNNLLSTWRFAL